MANWNYEQLALRRPEDRQEVVRRINQGWELVGLTMRGRGGRNVVHAIMRSRKPETAEQATPAGRVSQAVR